MPDWDRIYSLQLLGRAGYRFHTDGGSAGGNVRRHCGGGWHGNA
ncbi:MAG: hypothetical protein SVU32_03230 [Candidatus Nanohaloarchaea archaeon]|nr:hypothetical protein [Candidatus Nanohaloarchaea archaeon]